MLARVLARSARQRAVTCWSGISQHVGNSDLDTVEQNQTTDTSFIDMVFALQDMIVKHKSRDRAHEKSTMAQITKSSMLNERPRQVRTYMKILKPEKGKLERSK